MTARTRTLQDRCANPAQEKCIWHNQGFNVDLVQNVEGFYLKIRHDVEAKKVKASNAYSTGFVNIAGKHYQMHCASEGSCDKGDLGHMKSMSVCNRTDCWSTKYADYLSMDLVLRAANMSLDAQLPMPSEANLKSASDLPRRFLGASLAIDIRYENVQPVRLWPLPPQWFQFKNSYTYTFRKMGDYASETDISDASDTRRLLFAKRESKFLWALMENWQQQIGPMPWNNWPFCRWSSRLLFFWSTSLFWMLLLDSSSDIAIFLQWRHTMPSWTRHPTSSLEKPRLPKICWEWLARGTSKSSGKWGKISRKFLQNPFLQNLTKSTKATLISVENNFSACFCWMSLGLCVVLSCSFQR